MKMRKDLFSLLVVFGISAILPIFIHANTSVMHLLIMCFIWAVVAESWDLMLGYAGVFTFGQVALFVIGSYASGMATIQLGISPWLAMLVAGLLTALVSVLIGLPCLRLKAAYVALLTFALHMILEPLLKSDIGRAIGTGGSQGLLNVAPLSIGGYTFSSLELVPWYYAALAISFLLIFAIYKIIHSWWGMAFVAIHDAESFGKSLGVDEFKYKLLVFAVSAFFTGVIGGFYAHYIGVVSTRILGLDLFLLLMVMQVIGGMGRFPGAVIGAFIATLLNELLRVAGIYRLVIFGAVVIVVVVLMPEGIMGVLFPVEKKRPFNQVSNSIHRIFKRKVSDL